MKYHLSVLRLGVALDISAESVKIRMLVVIVVQLVRAQDCGSCCWGFESPRSPFYLTVVLLG